MPPLHHPFKWAVLVPSVPDPLCDSGQSASLLLLSWYPQPWRALWQPHLQISSATYGCWLRLFDRPNFLSLPAFPSHPALAGPDQFQLGTSSVSLPTAVLMVALAVNSSSTWPPMKASSLFLPAKYSKPQAIQGKLGNSPKKRMTREMLILFNSMVTRSESLRVTEQ